jgi:hypothetical protein
LIDVRTDEKVAGTYFVMCGRAMNTKFIKPAKSGEGMFNAIYGGQYSKDYAYINGYYEGAVALIEAALDKKPQDLMIYPILYLTRHMVELHLKSIIRDIYELHMSMFNFGEVKEAPAQLNDEKLTTTHKLDVLFNMMNEALSKVTNQKIDQKIKSAILDIHNSDPDGQTYRYSVKRDGSKSLPDSKLCDLKNFGSVLRDVHFYLLGVAMWVENQHEERKSFYSSI